MFTRRVRQFSRSQSARPVRPKAVVQARVASLARKQGETSETTSTSTLPGHLAGRVPDYAPHDRDVWDRSFVSTFGVTYGSLPGAGDAADAQAAGAAAHALPPGAILALQQHPQPDRQAELLGARPAGRSSEVSAGTAPQDAIVASPPTMEVTSRPVAGRRGVAVPPSSMTGSPTLGISKSARAAARLAAAYDLAVVHRGPTGAPELFWLTPELLARSPYLARCTGIDEAQRPPVPGTWECAGARAAVAALALGEGAMSLACRLGDLLVTVLGTGHAEGQSGVEGRAFVGLGAIDRALWREAQRLTQATRPRLGAAAAVAASLFGLFMWAPRILAMSARNALIGVAACAGIGVGLGLGALGGAIELAIVRQRARRSAP